MKGEKKFYCKDKEGRVYSTDGDFIYVQTNKGEARLDLFLEHYYKLRPVNGIPILEIDGLRMHLVKEFKTPLDYSKAVVRKLGLKLQDSVLDTCTGLGYTAIEASNHANKVVTCEISDAVLTLAKWNPWSEKLFNNPRIDLIEGDIFDKIKGMESSSFDAIIHDPPRFSTAGQLYSAEFYSELHRVLKPGGTLFHYVGSVGKGKGRKIENEVDKRLERVGFIRFRYDERLQGILVKK